MKGEITLSFIKASLQRNGLPFYRINGNRKESNSSLTTKLA